MNWEWESFCSLENIYQAWSDFACGKDQATDVMKFAFTLEDNLLSIQNDLSSGTYQHGPYTKFVIRDPKERVIHKATVRDRVVHRLLYNYLLPIFHPRWLDCSFSCRPGFGQHRAIMAVRRGLLQCTENYTRTAFVLKCDIQKFFDHIGHEILYRLIAKRVRDERLLVLTETIISSFRQGVGLPIGNLTSQIFANVYMHEFDRFVKHTLCQRRYYRFADDFLFIVPTEREAEALLVTVRGFLARKLRLAVHPKKIILHPAAWGIDWLGKVLLPGYTLLRPKTRRRMMRKINEHVAGGNTFEALTPLLGSYHGLLIGSARTTLDREIRQMVALSR